MPVDGPVDRADVYKAGRRAATLSREREGVHFRYLDHYIDAAGPAVATTLPVVDSDVITPPGAVPPFFAGLLPEGRRLTALRRELKVSADDELSLVCAVGTDTVGDVQVVEEGGEPLPAEPAFDIPAAPGELDFSAIVGELTPADRVGLPGVQDKVSGRMIALPARRAGERFILKLNPPEYPFVVENEALMIELARTCGLPVVSARVLRDAHDTSALVVKRFDRSAQSDGTSQSRAVEDGCQLLGRWPADKYSISSEAMAHALVAVCAARSLAARDVFRQFAFAILTGNGDVHAKNISVLQDESGEWRIAPAYDLPSTVLYGDSTLALTLGGKRTVVSRRILLDFAETIGLRRVAAARWLGELIDGTESLPALIEGGAVPLPDDAVRRAVKELRYRRRLLTVGA